VTDGDKDLAQQIHELDFLDLLKIGFAGVIVYGSYRLVKRLTRSEEEE